MVCSKCGAQVETPTRFCPHCGQAVTPDSGAPAVETDIKAVVSMVLGLLSLLLNVFTGIPAVILGHLSRASIRRSNGRLKGEGMSLTGLILGYLSLFVFPVLATIVLVLVPNLFRPKIVANEASAVKNLRAIYDSAASYQAQHDMYPASLEELSAEGLVALDSNLASTGLQNGYRFTYKLLTSQKGYVVHADPVFIHTGERRFYMDASGVVRYETRRSAGANSPVVGP